MPVLRSHDDIRGLLRKARTVAVIGLSPDASRDSNKVAAYLKAQGYRIIGVNPNGREALGEPLHPSLDALPPEDLRAVDIAVIFRRSQESAGAAREAARLKIPGLWFQLGVASPEAIAEGERAGMAVVAESCIMVAHQVLLARSPQAGREP